MPSAKQPDQTGILFVCLGNICRSPVAEGLFLHMAGERGVAERFRVDSCGTGHWHIGKPPHEGSRALAQRFGVHLPSIARRLDPDEDFDRFHWLIAMDDANRLDLLDAGAAAERVRLLRSFDPAHGGNPDEAPGVPDPYGEGPEGFERMWRTIEPACAGLLEWLVDGRIGQ